MLSIVGERERTHLGSMDVHAQLLMVSNISYSVKYKLHTCIHSKPMYETAKLVSPIERGRINCSLITVTISVTLKSSRSLSLTLGDAAG